MASIRLERRDDGTFQATPDGYLGGLFSLYLEACRVAGAKYDAANRAQVVQGKRLGELVAALHARSFTVTASNGTMDAIRAVADQSQADQSSEAAALARYAGLKSTDGKTLFPFQAAGAAFLSLRKRAALFDAMGLGKTAQALAALPSGRPVVIVAPAAVKGVWERELRAWRPDYREVAVLNGRGSFRWPSAGEVVVLNYDILPAKVDTTSVSRETILIADESHLLKNQQTNRNKRFRALVHAIGSDGTVWILTGTPLLNQPLELWNVLDAGELAKDAFGSWSAFVTAFGGFPGSYGGYVWTGAAPWVPDALRRVSLRRERATVLPELPVKRYEVDTCPLDDSVLALLDEFVRELAASGVDLRTNLDLLLETRLARISFDMISRVRAALASAKIAPMLAAVEAHESENEPLVVFSAHRAPIDLLAGRPGWRVITGDVSAAVRTEIEGQFQRGELRGVGLTIKAGGVGITLTHACRALFVDREWTPALNAQAEDRVCRIGQNRGVIVRHLVGDHALEQRLEELLAAKQRLIEGSVEASAVGADPVRISGTPDELAKVVVADDTPDSAPPTTLLRGPSNPAEVFALDALHRLAAMDPDHAGELNAVGFSKFDGPYGHSLVEWYAARAGFTTKQWAGVLRLVHKYRRQVGEIPAAGENSVDMPGEAE